MADQRKVEVPQNALIGLAAGFGVTLLMLAFLMGRQTATPVSAPVAGPAGAVSPEGSSPNRIPLAVSPVQPPPPAVAAPSYQPPAVPSYQQPAPAVSIPPAQPQPVAVAASQAPAAPQQAYQPPQPVAATQPAQPRPAPAARPAVPPPQAAPSAPAAAAAAPPPPAAPSAESKQIAAYLAECDAVMASTGEMGDSNAFATSLLTQASEGNFSSFDHLITQTRKAQSDFARIHPPAAARDHYSLMKQQLADSLALLQKVRGASSTMDVGALTSAAEAGHAMEAKAHRLEELTKQLRARP